MWLQCCEKIVDIPAHKIGSTVKRCSTGTHQNCKFSSFWFYSIDVNGVDCIQTKLDFSYFIYDWHRANQAIGCHSSLWLALIDWHEQNIPMSHDIPVKHPLYWATFAHEFNLFTVLLRELFFLRTTVVGLIISN